MFRARALSTTLAIVIWTMGAVPAGAQTAAPQPAAAPSSDAVDAIVRSGMAAAHIPGLSLTVLRGGEIVRQSNYGWANLEHRLPVDAQTAFNIGSASKQIIAAGVMLLVQEGRVELDASISRYIQEVPAHWRPITVRHLLTHTSGLVREAPGFAPESDQPVMDVVRTAYPLPLLFSPGERFEYSNTGYFILAELIARTSGMPWPRFFHERFFEPLGMTATRATSRVDLIPGRAAGYEWKEDRFENVTPYLALRPSGAFVSTASDMARWERSLVRGTLLSRPSLAQMWTRARLNNGQLAPYGFGWRLEEVDGVSEIGHAGSLPGFRAYFARYPDRDLTVIALINANHGPAEPTGIVRAVAREMMGAGIPAGD
ncbi:MAG TPA: serine hydrolase domain-containing protein [Allosphingosinicella sp.]